MDAALQVGRRGVVGAVVVVVFVVVWGIVGVRGLVVDDSRWAWGMFPYVLETKVERVSYLDDDGHVIGQWKMPKKGRPAPSLQTGRTDERGYGYGKGAWDTLIVRLGENAWKTAPKQTAVVEVVHTTKRSAHDAITEHTRVMKP